MKRNKSRNWAFVVYPESAPENWKEILQLTGVEYAISPLHDSDKDPTEEDKKAHWHVIASWQNGTTTENVIKGITDSVSAPMPIALQSVKGYYRYFTHKDNPEKYQYEESEIQTINGFNILNYSDMSRHELDVIIMKIQDYIRENELYEYSKLIDKLKDSEMIAEWSIARSQTYFFSTYLRSRRYILENAIKKAEERNDK
jgi:hypothetical protein